MKSFTDQLGRNLSLHYIPRRIVSLVPSQTELLADLGLEQQILGITKFCVHPAGLREKKLVVGGTKKVNFKKVKALRPDIILCNKEENTQDMVLELEKITPVHVSDVKTIDDTLNLILQYGEIFGAALKAGNLISKISEELLQFKKYIKNQPIKKVAYFIWKDPWMVAGGDTFIDHLLSLNNYRNVYRDEKERYPVVELECLGNKGVELVLLSTEPFPFTENHKKSFNVNLNKYEFRIVDGEYFSWYGSRLLAAFSYFKSLRAS